MWRDSTVKWRHVQTEQRRRRTSPLQNHACFDPTVFFFSNVWRLTQKQREEYRRHRGWESRTCNGAGNNALRLPSRSFGRPVSEGATGQHHQRTHEQNGPETDLHGTHASKSNLCCRRPTHLSPQSGRRRRRWRSRERRASDATPLHRHAELGRQIKVPRWSGSAAGRVVWLGPPRSPPQQSLLPHSSAAQNAGEKAGGGGGGGRIGGWWGDAEGWMETSRVWSSLTQSCNRPARIVVVEKWESKTFPTKRELHCLNRMWLERWKNY